MVLSILKIPTNPLCWVIETILFLSEIYVFMGMEKDSGRFWNNTKHTKSYIDDNISALNSIHISICTSKTCSHLYTLDFVLEWLLKDMCILENSKPILLYVVNILKGLSPRKSNIRSLEFQIYPLALNNIHEVIKGNIYMTMKMENV